MRCVAVCNIEQDDSKGLQRNLKYFKKEQQEKESNIVRTATLKMRNTHCTLHTCTRHIRTQNRHSKMNRNIPTKERLRFRLFIICFPLFRMHDLHALRYTGLDGVFVARTHTHTCEFTVCVCAHSRSSFTSVFFLLPPPPHPCSYILLLHFIVCALRDKHSAKSAYVRTPESAHISCSHECIK